MMQILQKVPFLVELFINGTFILLYSLKSINKIPENWNMAFIEQILNVGTYVVPFVLLFSVVVTFFASKSLEEYIRRHVFSIVVFIPLLITFGDTEFAFWFSSVHLLSTILSLYDEDAPKKEEVKYFKTPEDLLTRLRLRPAQLVLLSFTAVIMIGTFLLMLPVSAQEGKIMGFVDAFFMATSATCVTGLATKSLIGDLSLFGQIVVLVLIQIGGLSIMTLYSSMTIILGRAMGMRDRVMMQDLLDVTSLEELFDMVVDIIKYTFLIELWGGVILTLAFTFEGFEFGTSIYYGFFHSISAFCNAGFALFDTSLETYANSPMITGTIAVLITLGGLGFIVLRELKEVVTGTRSILRLGFHSKVVILTSVILVAGGTLFIFFGEYLHALDNYTLWEKFQISFFQSVTLRTAGFNSIPLTNLYPHTLYVMALFMFIGGSPGSTAGGIKTTTLAILIQSIITTMKGRDKVQMWDRTIPGPIVVRATALTFISILITSFFMLVLMNFESEQSFLNIFFEVISAGGTVGLTLGITPFLSVIGKLAISLLMFFGRIGPLTLILAIGQQQKSSGKYDYPDGRIMIG